MKRIVMFAAVVCLSLVSGCRQKPPAEPPTPATAPNTVAVDGTWLRIHFVGGDALAGNADAAKLQSIAHLPESKRLQEKIISKLATELPRILWQKTNSTALAEKITPLLDDLFHAELAVAATADNNQPSSTWTLAAALSSERAQAWNTGLKSFFTEGGGKPARETTLEGFPGWETTRFRFLQAGRWTVLSWSSNAVAAEDRLVKNIKASGRPMNTSAENWLEMQVQPARTGPLLSLPVSQFPSQFTLSVSGKADDLKTRFRATYDTPLTWRLEPWLVPTNTIRDPLNSFTAVNGIQPLVKQQPWLPQLGFTEAPNQCFFWAQTDLPYQTFFAFPATGATNRIRELPPRLEKLIAPFLAQPGNGRLTITTNGTVLWRDAMPVLMPFLRAAAEPMNNFVLGGFFPAEAPSKPLPPELLAQFMGKTNLLYYDWEITETRLDQWRQISQLLLMYAGQMPPMDPSSAGNWLRTIAPKLGNTVTEITAISPTELAGIRKSHAGLTALELTLLSLWLDNPEFPGFQSPFVQSPMAPPAPVLPGTPDKKP